MLGKGFREKKSIGEVTFTLFMGRLNEIKGSDILLDAFTKKSAEYPSLKLVFSGRDGGMSKYDAYGSYRESRQAQIQHGVFGHVMAWGVYFTYSLRAFFKKVIVSL